MTKLPHENRNVKGRDDFPSYEIGGPCAHPYCSEAQVEAHHIWRRSFLSGAYDWVELWDGQVVGNKVGLCNEHHRKITENKSEIVLLKRGLFWVDGDWADILNPQPPSSPEGIVSPSAVRESEGMSGHSPVPFRPLDGLTGPPAAFPEERHSWPVKIQPGEKCPFCAQKAPIEKKREPAKKRQTLSIRCPKEREEDGVELLADMLAQGEEILRPGEKARPMYFTLADMLGLFLLNHREILE